MGGNPTSHFLRKFLFCRWTLLWIDCSLEGAIIVKALKFKGIAGRLHTDAKRIDARWDPTNVWRRDSAEVSPTPSDTAVDKSFVSECDHAGPPRC